jgi:hypothetical protein
MTLLFAKGLQQSSPALPPLLQGGEEQGDDAGAQGARGNGQLRALPVIKTTETGSSSCIKPNSNEAPSPRPIA